MTSIACPRMIFVVFLGIILFLSPCTSSSETDPDAEYFSVCLQYDDGTPLSNRAYHFIVEDCNIDRNGVTDIKGCLFEVVPAKARSAVIKYHPYKNIPDREKKYRLIFGVSEGNIPSAEELTKEMKEKVAQLVSASGEGDIKKVNALLNEGTPIDALSEFGYSALMWSCDRGQFETAKLLLDRGANLFLYSPNHGNAFSAAVGSQRLDLVKLLIKKGVDVSEVNYANQLALDKAMGQPSCEILLYLISKGLKPAVYMGTHSDRSTALHRAVFLGNTKAVEILVSEGVDINCHDAASGSTPLHHAVDRGHIEILKILLKAKVKINVRDKKMDTPLIIAAREGDAEMVNILLEHRANKRLKNKYNKTALDAASENKGSKKIFGRKNVDYDAVIKILKHSSYI